MSLLDQISGGLNPSPRRTLLYAVHGWGKSTFASQMDQPIFVPTEDGICDIPCDAFFKRRNPPKCSSYDECLSCLESLYKEPRDYKTVVIDSGDWLERLIWQEVATAKKVADISEIDYQRGFEFVLPYWRAIINGLDYLRNDCQMTVMILAHAKIEKFANPETESYDRYSPKLHKNVSYMLQEWCDEVLFGTYKVFTTAKDEGFNKTRTQGVGVGERIIRTTERPAHLAKNRLGLPPEIVLPSDKSLAWKTYSDFATAA